MQKRSPLLPWLAVLFSSPLAALAGQFQVEPPPDAHQAAALTGFGLVEQFGELSAQGPLYRAHFHPAGFEYVPVLGLLAPKEYPLMFELHSVRRGDVPLAQGDVVLPTREDPFAVYERGAVRERYEARADGVELTFEFTSLPAGGGDIVVRGRIDCELPARMEPSGSILFEAEGLGGIRIGGVLGIDAKGRRAVGSSRMDGNVLELRLPAEFVAQAELPLILDPLIGTVQNITGVKSDPRIDADSNPTPTLGYAVVFEREFSASSIQVYGQRLGANGAAVGAPVPISSAGGGGGGLHTAPRVIRQTGNANYWVAWEYRSIAGANGSTRVGELTSGSTPAAPIQLPKDALAADSLPSLGTASGFGTAAVLAFLRNQNGQQRIQYCTLTKLASPAPSGSIATGTLETVPLGTMHPSQVVLSKGTDNGGLSLLVYRVRVQTSPVRHQIHCRALPAPAPGTPPASQLGPVLVINDPAVDFVDVAVAGGRVFNTTLGRWQLAVEADAVLPPLTLHRVETIAVQQQSSMFLNLTAGPRKAISTSATALSKRPSIASSGVKYHISYSERPTAVGYRLRFAELDLTDAPARVLSVPSVSWSTPRYTAVATRWPYVNPLSPECGQNLAVDCDQGMLAWPISTSPVDGAAGLQYSLFEALGSSGTATPAGPSCGHGQISASTSPAVGHPKFTVELSGAGMTPHLSLLNLSTNPGLTTSCGGCPVLLPESLTPVDVVNGSASISFAIPNLTSLIGVPIAAQWLRLATPGSSCPELLGLGASDVLLVTFGE